MRYPFSVFQTQVEGHIFWIAKSEALRGCVGQGESQEEAVAELTKNEIEWIKTAEEVGIPVPEIPIETLQEFSGKLTLRVSPTVHKQASLNAKKEGISLNQYINDAIVARNAEISTTNYISKRVASMVDQIGQHFFKYSSNSRSEAVLDFSFPVLDSQKFYCAGLAKS